MEESHAVCRSEQRQLLLVVAKLHLCACVLTAQASPVVLCMSEAQARLLLVRGGIFSDWFWMRSLLQHLLSLLRSAVVVSGSAWRSGADA